MPMFAVTFCSMVLDSLCSLKVICLMFFEPLLMGLDAALGMAAASFFVLKSKKDTAESPTTSDRLSEGCGNALKIIG